jgi:hypothetical protein
VTVAYEASAGQQLWAKSYDGRASGSDAAWSVASSPDGTKVFRHRIERRFDDGRRLRDRGLQCLHRGEVGEAGKPLLGADPFSYALLGGASCICRIGSG